jgi:flagellar biosynthetic protein FlhB
MPDSPTGEKTEAPTPRKREEARQDGNVAHSQDLTAAVGMFGAMLLLGLLGMDLFVGMRRLVQTGLSGEWALNVVHPDDLMATLTTTSYIAIRIVLPIALGLFVITVIANILQVGFLLSGKAIVPKFSKLSPISGAKNLFSGRAAMRLVMSLAKVGIVLAVATWAIISEFPMLITLIHLSPAALIAAAATEVWIVSLKIAAVLILLALLDFMYQKWQHEQDLKMSKQDIKEEMRSMEGDPQVKQRRANVARQLAMQRMGQAVPQADVVVTNPTHYAVALKYDDSMASPKVVAKGVDYMAMRIRQLAAANDVPIVERPPLARALYRNVEVGEEIPEKFFAAVAEILAYVYRIKGRTLSAADAQTA